MKKWLTRVLFDWVFVLLYGLFQGFLNLVKFIESFFDIFAGTAKVFYKGNAEFLINIFFGHSAVTNAFWAMALIAIVLAFGFCIVQVSRKVVDVTGSVKQSIGQIFSNFFRCMLIILLLNLVTVAVINITNVLLDRINYALENAAVLNQEESEKTFSDQEYAVMARILATVANYSVNPSADSRYNINSCFNAIRPDLLSLYVNGFFNYDYLYDANGHHTWQGALALLASSADLTTDLQLDVYYADVANAVLTVSQELNTYRDFAPVERAHFSVAESINTDVLIFLIAGMEASQNSMYNTGSFNDALRKGYISGQKSYNNLKQVRKDFDIWQMDYLVGYIACGTFIIIMAICIFTFIVRMFNLLLLYLTAPLFASSMPMDDGGKWQSWVQAFVIQLFSGFGLVVAMRLYLIIIPIVISSDLVFFAGKGLGYAILNHFAQLLMVLGGAWAVLQSGGVITGILAGNPGMAAIQQEGRIGSMVTGWALRAPKAALGAAAGIMGAPMKMAGAVKGAQAKMEQGQQQKVERLDRRAQQRQNRADSLYAQANKRLQDGKNDSTTRGLMERAEAAQIQADKASFKAAHKREVYGMGGYAGEGPRRREPGGAGHSAGSEARDASASGGDSPGFSEIQVSRDRASGPSDQDAGGGFREIRIPRGGTVSGSAPSGAATSRGTTPASSARSAATVPGGGGSAPSSGGTAARARAAVSGVSDTSASSGGGTAPRPPAPASGFSEIRASRSKPASTPSSTPSTSSGGGVSEIRVTRTRQVSQTPGTGENKGGEDSAAPPRKR